MNKGKSKGKGKKGFWMEAQAWFKGRGKGKAKDFPRSVNAYTSDLYLSGLELAEALEFHSVRASPPLASEGMLDCGATASAAPEAVVQSLISPVLSHDKAARVEVEQYSRPHFRFGNGKWGEALCVHLCRNMSGQVSWSSLYALPNPDSYNQNPLDTSALVPVLVGMDFLGKDGVGMMIDFHTGLAMNTKDASPQIFQLMRNHKGHFILDIAQHLTKGHTRHEGQAHVLVRSTPTTSSEPFQNQVLELGTV